MNYYLVRWHHRSSSDPTTIAAELDSDRYEVRKVELFENGKAQFADHNDQTGDTFLSSEPWPAIDEIVSDPQFTGHEIDVEEFTKLWAIAKSS